MSDVPEVLSDYEYRDKQQPHCRTCGGVLEYIISKFSKAKTHQCNACFTREVKEAYAAMPKPYRCPLCGGGVVAVHGKDKYMCNDCKRYSPLAELRAKDDWMPMGDDEPVG